MTGLSETQRRGQQILSEMLGETAGEAAAAHASSGQLGADVTSFALDNVFAGIWSRPQLDRRARSLVTIGALIAGKAEHELRNHFRIAIRHGLSPTELEEIILQLLPYVGFAATGPALGVLTQVLRELGLETESKLIIERGLV